MLNIALPKGRLGDQVYELLASVGYDCKSIYDENRKLVFENPQTGVRYLLVKPSDVAIYVEHHAADVGIVGKDILMESNPDVYELLDLGLGKCRMCVAGKEDYVEDKDRPVRVVTFDDLPRPDLTRFGAVGSPTRVERIFAPEAGAASVVLAGTAAEKADQLAKLLAERKYI